ncbi:TetR/AcrR family transcriptional regulator [Streptomyces sp. NPDC057362]|uniref:TetR/AcrR family transcriptional regulator n=1 Tax=Streptomyces sp. NPDC057362 TaxID=3346106 RepID=UPI00362DDC8F
MTSETSRPVGRRERSKQRVREGIYSSALSLFVEQGYERTTIEQITDRADVARATFFNYFQRKEDLVTAWSDQRKRQLESFMQDAMESHDDDVTVLLERCIAALAEFNERDRKVTATMLQAWVKAGQPLLEERHAGQVFATIIEAGRTRGDIAVDIDPLRAGNILRDSYLGLLYRWSQDPEAQPSLHVELREILRIILTGVRGYGAGTR